MIDGGDAFDTNAGKREPKGRDTGTGVVIAATGRAGPLLADDPFTGTTTDWTMSPAAGWGEVKPVAAHGSNFPGATLFKALSVQPAVTADSVNTLKVEAVSVTKLGSSNKWIYKFSRNIVGHVQVAAGSYRGAGTLKLEHCEIMNATHPTECSALGGLPNVTDIHIVDSTSTTSARSGTLRPRFTWHGFQYVVVEAEAAAGKAFEFDAKQVNPRGRSRSLPSRARALSSLRAPSPHRSRVRSLACALSRALLRSQSQY